MILSTFNRGDRVRLLDGRLVELAWPCWPFGIDEAIRKKTKPSAWFVREIVDDFGTESRSEPFPLEADVEVTRREYEFMGGIGDDDGKRGGDSDPLAVRSSDGPQGVLGV